MKTSIKKALSGLVLGAVIFLFNFGLVIAADTVVPDKYGASNVYKRSMLSVVGISQQSPMDLIQGIVRLALGFIGIVLFGLILYAGFTWIKARDNTAEVDKAKNIIESSLYGVIIIVLAYGISEFIFSRLTGAS